MAVYRLSDTLSLPVPGLTLVTPTSIANSGGSSSASGGQITATGVTSISLNGVFTSAYDNYRIVIVGTNSAEATISYRMRVSGTDSSTGNYDFQNAASTGTTTASARTAATTLGNIGYLLTTSGVIDLTMYSPFAAAPTVSISNNAWPSGTARWDLFAGWHNLSTSYDGITLITSTGTMTAVIRVYAYENA